MAPVRATNETPKTEACRVNIDLTAALDTRAECIVIILSLPTTLAPMGCGTPIRTVLLVWLLRKGPR